MSAGRVYLVGAGPGDPGLLTLRGRELLSQADVVVYDYLVSPCLLDHTQAAAERVYVGKRGAEHTLGQEEINQLLIGRARGGAAVVRLKGGDPFVFGRGGEEALALAEAGIPFEVVPGVTAAIAGAAYAGIPVTHRDLASSLVLATGHEAAGKNDSALDWRNLARCKGTVAFYMGMGNIRAICERLVQEGMEADTPAAVVRWATTPRQRVVTGHVAELPRLAEQTELGPPALIIIGSVVKLRERLAWFENRPLFGRRIVVTRPSREAGQLACGLEALGAEVVLLPTIRIEPPQDLAPLKQALRELPEFDWVVFTSVNAVEAFFDALSDAGLDARALASNRVCVIGPATAGRLARFGVRADARPPRFTGDGIVETLSASEDLSGLRILCPRADIAPPHLIEALASCGAVVREVTAYRTVPETLDAQQVAELLACDEVHWLTFTSSSTARSFFSITNPDLVRRSSLHIASIGPSTSATVRQFGLEPAAEAEAHTIGGLIDVIVKRERAIRGSP